MLLVGWVLFGLAGCQTNEPDFTTKIQLAAANMRALPGYNDGSIANSTIIAEGPNYALIQNKSATARRFPAFYKNEKIGEGLTGVFDYAHKDFCTSKSLDPASRLDFKPEIIDANTVLFFCQTPAESLTLAPITSIQKPPLSWVAEQMKSPQKVEPVKPPAGTSQDQEVIQISSGTGFAITNDGHIVTNNHVIKGCSKVMLANDGKYVPLRVVSNDPTNDLAVLKGDFEPTETFSVNKGNPELMQDIYVAGYPFGKKVSTSVKVTRGIISSLTGYGNNFSGIQIDAAIQPGNSGGPIFDDKGNVVGVVVSKLAKQGSITPENTNFGVKANILANLLVSNAVPFSEGKDANISKSGLSKKASDATFYLSCWNTVAEAKKMRTKKVMFSDLD